MAKVSTSISIDADVKAQAQELFADLGMDMSTAINVFLRQAIRDQRMPFDISMGVPNTETKAALQEMKEMKEHPEKYKRYSYFGDALKEALTDA